MMINGWRRFKWSSLLENNFTALHYKDPGYISVDGHLAIRDTKRKFANKPFVVFINSVDSFRIIRMSSTDMQGHFRFDSLLFFDKARLFFKDIRGKKSDLLDIKLSGDSLARIFHLPGLTMQNFYFNEFPGKSLEKMLAYDYEAIQKAEGITLVGVTVKAKRKNSLRELEEKYAKGVFRGTSERTIDMLHANDVITSENILDYLSNKIPSLNVYRDGLDYYVYYRQGLASVSAMGLIPMILYLDEIETDASFIFSIPASEVAMVKVYSSFVGAVGNGAGGALAVYTKKGSDLYNDVSKGDMVRYQGYSIIKEFYAPDYAVDTVAIINQDNRITLLWAPQISVNGINENIPVTFYNSDRTKQYRIVVEGMTIDGKLLMIEKIVGRKPF
jgi:hypothetical protein